MISICNKNIRTVLAIAVLIGFIELKFKAKGELADERLYEPGPQPHSPSMPLPTKDKKNAPVLGQFSEVQSRSMDPSSDFNMLDAQRDNDADPDLESPSEKLPQSTLKVINKRSLHQVSTKKRNRRQISLFPLSLGGGTPVNATPAVNTTDDNSPVGKDQNSGGGPRTDEREATALLPQTGDRGPTVFGNAPVLVSPIQNPPSDKSTTPLVGNALEQKYVGKVLHVHVNETA